MLITETQRSMHTKAWKLFDTEAIFRQLLAQPDGTTVRTVSLPHQASESMSMNVQKLETLPVCGEIALRNLAKNRQIRRKMRSGAPLQ